MEQVPDPRFSMQDLVVIRDGDGNVGFVRCEAPTMHAGEYWYLVQFGAASQNCRESDLEAHVESEDLATLLAGGAYAGPEGFRRQVTAVKLHTQLTDTLYAYGASKTQLYPYQFIPLLKFLASPYRRILIADEVGLGKTIEAGYVLQEELARGRLSRILVVCPASLRHKWHDELLNRFNHRFEILNAVQAQRRIPISDAERRTAHPLRAIVSLQSLRNERFIQTIHSSHAPIDLLIVDEAHHCRNSQTYQSQAVSALMEQSDAAVFLSATPIQTHELNLFTLLHMLVPEEFPSEVAFQQRLELNKPIVRAETLIRQPGQEPLQKAAELLRALEQRPAGDGFADNPLLSDLLRQLEDDIPDSPARRVDLQERLSELNLLSNIFTRTKRRDVHLDTAQRNAIVPIADLSDYEQTVYTVISNFIFTEYQARVGDSAARLVLVTYQRQIASSLPAAVRKFATAIQEQEAIWDDELELPDDLSLGESQDAPAYRPSADPRFQQLITEIDVDRLEEEDTKYQLLVDSIKEQHSLVSQGHRRSRKLIVFSYFRRSLDYLERRLGSDGFRFVRIDGSVPTTPDNPETDERLRRIEKFRLDSQIDLLLTSEVSSEGIDLQFCDTIVNWDLPWNPMVVEQRIGRIDRIGQQSPQIFVINIAARGTIEARILNRLYDRIGIFEHSIGELEPILGQIVRELEEELFRPELTQEQQEQVVHARKLAIENQAHQQQALEEQASLLIGHDEFFHNKLDNLERFGRYVGGDELRLFVSNELQAAIPGLELTPAERQGVYRLPYRQELQTLFERMLTRDDEEVNRFLSRLRRGEDKITFHGELADEAPNVDPIHAQHPLVRALSARMGEQHDEQPQVARLRVESDIVSPGPWFFAWALVKETGFLAARSLMCSVVNLSDDKLDSIEDDAGDRLLAQMIRIGCSWTNFNSPSVDQARQCLGAAEERIRKRVVALDDRRKARVEAIKQARRNSIESTFGLRIDRQQERTQEMELRAEAGNAGAARILPAYRARLEQLKGDLDSHLDRLEDLSAGTATYWILGAGFVDVMQPNAGRRDAQ